ncbi:MAG: S-layer homology domain-containing protein [Deltaproteobacteria bacterium]
MQKWVCEVLEFVLLLTLSYIPPLKSADAVSFSDVSSGYWAASEISDLAGKGVLSGYPNGAFKPATNVARAEFAKIIGLAMGYSPNPSASQRFPDVAQIRAFDYIASAVDHGLVQGYPDGTFGPSRNVTKAEILTIIARAQNWSERSGSHRILHPQEPTQGLDGGEDSLLALAAEALVRESL